MSQWRKLQTKTVCRELSYHLNIEGRPSCTNNINLKLYFWNGSLSMSKLRKNYLIEHSKFVLYHGARANNDHYG